MIDPTLAYSTYLGGSADEAADGGEDGPSIAVDSTGHAYVAATTYSTDFPAKGFKNGDVGYVAKFNPTGSALVYASYFGPKAYVGAVAVDKDGSAYIAGEAHEGTPGKMFGDGADGPFVAKFGPKGALIYTALLGGGGPPAYSAAAHAVAVDSLGNAYVTGHVGSNGFPATSGAFRTSVAGGTDAFVAKVNPAGSALVYATFVGGTGNEDTNGIAVDKNFNAYITGGTNSPDYPTTKGAFDRTLGVCSNLDNAFVTKLNPTGTALIYSTFLGGGVNNARALHTATLLPGGEVLVAGGSNNCDYVTRAALYNPASGTWKATGSLNTVRRSHTATLLNNGKVLVAGGEGPDDTSAELYDPATRNWTSTGSLNNGRYLHTATLLPNGMVLVAGGLSNDGSPHLASAEVYDPASGTWTLTGSLNMERYYHTASLLANGKVLVTGGIGPDPASAELYDPASKTWTQTGSLHTGRYLHAATLLPSGKVLVAGGLSDSGVLASAELFEPASKTWKETGNLHTGRYQHTATLLANGKVLVAGGLNGGSVTMNAEVYDPANRTWRATDSLHAARFQHTATLLEHGKVLVAGGYRDTSGDVVATAELYVPARTAWVDTGKLGYNSGSTVGVGIAVNSSGEAHVAGRTSSSGFPITAGAFDQVFAGSETGFVTSLSANGKALVYSTFLGGTAATGPNDYTECDGIALDSANHAYVTGVTSSTDFPVKDAFQQTIADNFPGNGDAFVTELAPNGTTLIYSSYLGGSESDNGTAIAVDQNGAAYITGGTTTNFPTTAGAFRGTNAGQMDNFITKVRPASGTLGDFSPPVQIEPGNSSEP